MEYIDRIVPNRVVLTVLVLSFVLAGYWMTNWSTNYLTGVMIGFIAAALISEYPDESAEAS